MLSKNNMNFYVNMDGTRGITVRNKNCVQLFRYSVYITTDPQPFPRQVIHCGRASLSSFIIISLRSSSNCLSLRPRLSVPSVFSSTTCFVRQFLSNMWPVPLAFQGFVVCRTLLSFLTLYNIYFSHDQSSWYPQFFSGTTFQNFSGTSDLRFKVSKF